MLAYTKRAIAGAVAAGVLLLPALLAPVTAAAQTPSGTSINTLLDAEEVAAVRALNEHRASLGLPPFTVSPILTRVAEWMAADQASRDLLDHTDLLGRGLRDRNNAFGYPSNTALRENLAAGRPGGAATMQQWMDSPGHYRNNIATDVVAIGMARVPAAAGSPYGWFWALEFGSYEDPGTLTDGAGAGATPPSPPVTSIVPVPASNAPVGTGAGTFSSAFPERGVGINVWNGGSLQQLTAGVEQGGGRVIFVSADGVFRSHVVGAPAFVNSAFTATFGGGEVPAGTVVLIVR